MPGSSSVGYERIIHRGLLAVVVLFFTYLAPGVVKPDSLSLCGPRSLLVVCEILGVDVDLEEVCTLSQWTEDQGVSMLGLYQAARRKGLHAVGVKTNLAYLSTLHVPVMAHTLDHHFLVVTSSAGDSLRVIDPPEEPRLMSKDTFSKIWDGYALIVSKQKLNLGPEGEGRLDERQAANIQFEETVYDFGEVGQDEKVIHIFHFKNSEEAPLPISRVESSCGCTAALLSKKNIPPEAAGQIEVRFDVGHWRGWTAEEVRVYSNDPDEPVVELTVTAIVKAAVMAIPERLYVGDITGRKPIQRTVQVVDPGDGSLRVLKVEATSEYITAEVGPASEEGIPVFVTLQSDIPIGDIEELFVCSTVLILP